MPTEAAAPPSSSEPRRSIPLRSRSGSDDDGGRGAGPGAGRGRRPASAGAGTRRPRASEPTSSPAPTRTRRCARSGPVRVDLILSDLFMPGRSGLELLQCVLRDHPGTDFVLVTANASVASAVEALRMGATDYLEKPVRSEDLILALERALGRRRLLAENRKLRDELELVPVLPAAFGLPRARGPVRDGTRPGAAGRAASGAASRCTAGAGCRARMASTRAAWPSRRSSCCATLCSRSRSISRPAQPSARAAVSSMRCSGASVSTAATCS